MEQHESKPPTPPKRIGINAATLKEANQSRHNPKVFLLHNRSVKSYRFVANYDELIHSVCNEDSTTESVGLIRFLMGELHSSSVVHLPKSFAALFALFLEPASVDAIVGDLQELYTATIVAVGSHRANLWLLKQFSTSLLALAWASLKRISGFDRLRQAFRRE